MKKMWAFEYYAWLYPDLQLKKICATLVAKDPAQVVRKEDFKRKTEFERRTVLVSDIFPSE